VHLRQVDFFISRAEREVGKGLLPPGRPLRQKDGPDHPPPESQREWAESHL